MKIQDIHTSDKSLWQQYADNYKNGQYSSALAILQNQQLSTKAITANVVNTMSDAVEDVQELYYTNVEDVLADDADKFNTAIGNIKDAGAYNSTTVYYKGNFASDGEDVYLYISNTPSAGNGLDNQNYWIKIGLRGKQGAPGLGVNLRYNWQSGTQYYADDVVYYSGALYYAKADNINSAPSKTSTTWGLMLEIDAAKIYVAEKPPIQHPYTGLLWWKIVDPYTWADVDNLNYTFADIDALNLSWIDANEGGF